MTEPQNTPANGWQLQQHPPLMTKRFEFASYAQTRGFLDLLAELSKRTGYYPDLNFGKTYASVNITPAAGGFEQAELDFAAETDVLAAQARS